MSYQPLWLQDLVAYSIQAAALVGVGAMMASLLRLRVPRVRLAYWQALLAVCVFLPLLQPWRPEVLETSEAALSKISFAASPAAVASSLSLSQSVLLVICAGIVLRMAWMALGLGRLWLYRRNAQRIEQVPQAIEEAQRLVRVSPAFFISRQLPTPATFGYFRPTILFPVRFLGMAAPMQKAVALHELLHVERRDWLWNMFEEVVLTLLWFHLPLWWVVRSVRLSREQVVDAAAVRRSNARHPYLKALLEMAGQQSLAESLPAPLFLRESQLAERVALMMKEVHMSRTRLMVSILAAAGVLLVAAMTMVWAFPLKTSAQQSKALEASSAAAQSEAGAEARTSTPEGGLAAQAGSAGEHAKIYKVGNDVQAPDPIYDPEPSYTPAAKKAHLGGNVVLSVVVDANGRVMEVKQLSRPLGKGLDESAINTVRTWKFRPAMRDGVAVPVRVHVEVGFKHNGSRKSGPVSQESNSIAAPPAQPNPTTPEVAKDNGPSVTINQAEIQRQVEEAMKQAKIAQLAAPKNDQKKIQEQVEQAMKQAKVAQSVTEKLNSQEFRRQIEQAVRGAEIARQAAEKIDNAEFQRQIERLRRQAEIARQQAEKARQESQKIRREIKPPLPPAPPLPNELEPAPAPSPVPPSPPTPSPNR